VNHPRIRIRNSPEELLMSNPNASARAAIALVAAVSVDEPAVSVEELLKDADPILVVSLLARSLHRALGAAVGARGRAAVLQELGLDVARGQS
jgi:hypothetical protein